MLFMLRSDQIINKTGSKLNTVIHQWLLHHDITTLAHATLAVHDFYYKNLTSVSTFLTNTSNN